MKVRKVAVRLMLAWLLAGWVFLKMSGWYNLAGSLMLSALLGVLLAVVLLVVYRVERKPTGAERKWWAVAGVVVISLLAADLMREHLMSVRFLVAYGGGDSPAVVVLDNEVVLIADVEPIMKTPSGGTVIQEPFARSATLGLPTTEWRINDFEARSLGWGGVEITLPGAKITYRKHGHVIVNGERTTLALGFWDRVFGRAELIMVPANGPIVAVPPRSVWSQITQPP